MPNDEENNIIITEGQLLPDDPPAVGTPATENPTSEDVTETNKPEIEVFGKHQSEYDLFKNQYAQKTGFGATFDYGKRSFSGSLFMLKPDKWQVELIGKENVLKTNIKNNPQDIFSMDVAFRNQTNFSSQGVNTSNRISVQESYTHKFDNGLKFGLYANQNTKLNISSDGAYASFGYIAGASLGKGRVSGYIENQGDFKLTQTPAFGSYINAGVVVKL